MVVRQVAARFDGWPTWIGVLLIALTVAVVGLLVFKGADAIGLLSDDGCAYADCGRDPAPGNDGATPVP